ncbi:MAG: ATP-binding protein [Desulfobacterales bacterium]
MHTETEKAYLLQALEHFNRKIIVISPDFKILAASGRESAGLEKTPNPSVCYETIYNRLAPCACCPAQKTLRTRKPTLREIEVDQAHSGRMTCLYSYPLLTNGVLEAIAVVDFDLPVLEKLEDRLKRSNAFFRNLIRSAVDGVVAADKTGKVFIFNDAAAEITGYSVAEALSHLDIRQIYPEGEAYEIMRKLRSEAYGGRRKLKFYATQAVRKDGAVIPINLNAALVCDDDQEVATIGFFHDRREELRIKRELEKTQVQLLQAEKMASLGKLAAGVAHQLNNPLSGITLFSKIVLEDYELPAEAREDLERILRDAQRCRDTVKELLEFARQTRQLMKPNDINKAISRTLFLLQSQTLFQNIEIQTDLAPDLPPVQSDIQQINHLFMNIILNAAEAMEGKGRLSIKTVAAPAGDRALIEIDDSGPGIPENVLPHIFEPFFTTKEEGKGTGLGLSLVYGIVENHGGTIRASSRVGEGTTFFIELCFAGKEENAGKPEAKP